MRLDAWLDPRHLLPGATEALATAFAAHPVHSAIIDDFLQEKPFALLQRAFREELRFERAYAVFDHPDRQMATAERFFGEPDKRRFFTFERLAGVLPGREFAPGVLCHLKFTQLLLSLELRRFLSAASGMDICELEPSWFARTQRRGDMARRHNDLIEGRRLCAVYYLGPEWQPGYGARLRQFIGDDTVGVVEPRPNRLVFFEVKKEFDHDVEDFADAMGDQPRWAYTLWYGAATDGAEAFGPVGANF